MNLDDLEPRNKLPAKKDLTTLSVGELESYIAELQAEIERARATIDAKKSHRSGAESLFKR